MSIKFILVLITVLILMYSCAGRKVRTEDLNSWQGQSTSVLERHRIFSALPREERSIPQSADKFINYYQRKVVESDRGSCLGTGFGMGPFGLGSSVCSPREVEERACVHQFLIRDNRVQEYRVLGEDCYTECEYRPQGVCPEDKK